MEVQTAVAALAALAHGTRLQVFRLLVRAGPDGLAAGAVAERLGLPAATLSFHMSHLSRASLVRARREGRSIRYAADFVGMRALIDFLFEDCCRGQSEHTPRPKSSRKASK